MQFYKIKAGMQSFAHLEALPFTFKKGWGKRMSGLNIQERSIEFRNLREEADYYFVSEIKEVKVDDESTVSVTAGALVLRDMIDLTELEDYFGVVGLDIESYGYEEITMRGFLSLLTVAEDFEFVSSAKEVLTSFKINRLDDRRVINMSNMVMVNENMIHEPISKARLIKTAGELLVNETLLPEIERIYSGKKNAKAFGQPVHYFLEIDGYDAQNTLCRSLLQAMYGNGRILNRRYCDITIKPESMVYPAMCEAMYLSCCGGAVVINYEDAVEFGDDDLASSGFESISRICKLIRKYRNRVLTVICLPRKCDKTKRMFTDNLGDVCVMEIKEDNTNKVDAEIYLKKLAKERHVRSDGKLFEKLQDGKTYTAEELREMFESWYGRKLRVAVFPQYSSVSECRIESYEKQSKGTAYDRLQSMIGLTEAKKVIDKALAFYKMQQLYSDRGICSERPAMHMVFTGNPGTAKTSVARLFAGIMRDNRLLSGGQLVEVGRNDLVAKYVGWTAKTVKEKFEEAKGGVLFIDEAYSLVDDRDGCYGDEAINTIVQEMENHREEMIVIFAGYPEKMEGFLDKNPGLRSRIAFHVPFENYTTEELCEIAEYIGKEKGVRITEEAMAKLAEVFETAKSQPDFGNGRYVKNIIELSKMNMAGRIVAMKPEEVTQEVLTSLEEVDIEIPAAGGAATRRVIGF